MDKITFSTFHLVIDEKKPIINDFLEYEEKKYTKDNNVYKITTKKIEDSFYWIYIEYGTFLPYSEEVYDKNSSEIINNPRNKNQTELNHQLFCCYDAKENVFYISNSQKKSFVELYLQSELKKSCIIKRFFKNKEDFINQIKSISQISFTSKKNLFSINNDIFSDDNDVFGLGQPEDFKIQIDYSNKKITEKFKNYFNEILSFNTDNKIDSLVCIGKDDKNIESIFDIKSFTQTRKINIKKDEFGRFNQDNVLDELLKQINKEKE